MNERHFTILAQRAAGATLQEIADRVGCTKQRIAQICAAYGLPRRLRESSANARLPKYTSTKWHAQRRGVVFLLPRERFYQLVTQTCTYGTGNILSGIKIGVDRKDNFKGYEEGNCVPCCSRHNWLRSNNFSYEEFLDAVKRYPKLAACGNRILRTKVTR